MHAAAPISLKPKKQKKQWNLFFLALPLILVVFLFSYVPLMGWILALFEYKPGYAIWDCEFVGLKYFQILLTNANTSRVMKNTLIFSGLGFLCLPMPMLLAVLLNEINSTRFRKAAQVITTLPHFISWVIVYSVFFSIFSSEGMLNQVFRMLGMKRQSILTDRDAVYWFQTLITQWKGVGWGSIIYIAAIAGIDQELYEAAYVDGAGRFRKIFSITVPSILPVITIMFILRMGEIMNGGFDQIVNLYNSFTYSVGDILDTYAYRMGLEKFDYSYSTAITLFKNVIGLGMVLLTNYITKRLGGEGVY